MILASLEKIVSEDVDVTRTSGGFGPYEVATGHMNFPVTLHFDIKVAFSSDSDLDIRLTTRSATSPDAAFTVTGSPLKENGDVTLVGASEFRGGSLGTYDCAVEISGRISPHP